MTWVLDYLDDLESDFSVFHRIDDIFRLDGPRFFRLAARIFAYDGVMAKRLAAMQKPSGQTAVSPSRPGAKSTGWQSMGLEEAHSSMGERRVVRRG